MELMEEAEAYRLLSQSTNKLKRLLERFQIFKKNIYELKDYSARDFEISVSDRDEYSFFIDFLDKKFLVTFSSFLSDDDLKGKASFYLVEEVLIKEDGKLLDAFSFDDSGRTEFQDERGNNIRIQNSDFALPLVASLFNLAASE